LSFRQSLDSFRDAVIDRATGLAMGAGPQPEYLAGVFQGNPHGREFVEHPLGGGWTPFHLYLSH